MQLFLPSILTIAVLGSTGGWELPTLSRRHSVSSRRRELGEACKLLLLTWGMRSAPANAMEQPTAAAASAPQNLKFQTLGTTGVQVADIQWGTGSATVERDSKINFHVKGRLLGKGGWIFEDSHADDDPYRLEMGVGKMVPGLEMGLVGMKEGGIRRIVVPSEEGYRNKQLEPIPRDFGNRRRLYTTVMNSVRVERERSEWGSDLAGKVVFDVEVLRIR